MNRKFHVRGICFVPTECMMEIEARSESEAVTKALEARWQNHIDSHSGDNSAAFDWNPIAEEIRG